MRRCWGTDLIWAPSSSGWSRVVPIEDDATDRSSVLILIAERAARDSFDDAQLQVGEDAGGHG